MNRESLRALQQAAGLFGQGRLADAETICRRLVAAHPGAVDPANLLALIRKQAGDLIEAERLMRGCLACDPRRADVRANLGNLLSSVGRVDEAENEYRGALATEPSFRQARLGLARLLLNSGRNEAAASEAQELIEHNGDDAEAWNVLGSANRYRLMPEEAESAFRRALQINPDYAVARHNLGALLAQLSRSEEALQELDRSSAAGVRGPEIDSNRASVLMDLYHFDEAEELLADAIRDAPAAANLQTLLARLRFMRGVDAFAEDYAQAVAANPDDVGLRLGYSRVLRGAGKHDLAEAALLEAPESRGESARLLAELAGIYQDSGRFADALKHAEAAAIAHPGAPGLDDLRIDALTCLGRADEARPIIEDARRRQPLSQWYVAMEATVARLLGDPRYEELYDYEAFVRPFELSPPPGWSTIDAFHEDLIAALNERHRFVAEPLDQSLRHGTQTPRGLLGDPDPIIRAFLQMLDEPIAEYRATLGYDPAHPMRSRNRGEAKLIGCWSVRLKRGGYHVNHVHSEGWISSAYYVQVPEEVSDERKMSGWIKFGEPRFPVPGAAPEKFVQPAVGRLVLFPSYMWHGTTPILGDEPRMTIAFDVISRS